MSARKTLWPARHAFARPAGRRAGSVLDPDRTASGPLETSRRSSMWDRPDRHEEASSVMVDKYQDRGSRRVFDLRGPPVRSCCVAHATRTRRCALCTDAWPGVLYPPPALRADGGIPRGPQGQAALWSYRSTAICQIAVQIADPPASIWCAGMGSPRVMEAQGTAVVWYLERGTIRVPAGAP